MTKTLERSLRIVAPLIAMLVAIGVASKALEEKNRTLILVLVGSLALLALLPNSIAALTHKRLIMTSEDENSKLRGQDLKQKE